jgi:hypothetical protein
VYDTSLTIEQVVAQLAAYPPRLAALTAALSPAELHTRPGPGEWSLTEILAHLRSCGDMWGQAIATILAEDHPTIRAVNPTTWIKQTNYLDLEFRRSLRAFSRQRARLLAVLKALPPEGWSRGATVTGAGRPMQRTVLSYAEWLANHERSHVKHIQRSVEALKG